MNSWISLLEFIIMMALVRVGYETAEATERRDNSTNQTSAHLSTFETVVNHGLRERFPPERIAQIQKKELRRYQQAQKKKWDNWMEAVSR